MGVLSIESYDKDKVIVKVDVKSPLEVAQTGFSMDDAYITVTRGKQHTMTFITREGKTCSIEWGDGGITLISDSLSRLKREVIRFIEDQGILLEWDDGKIDNARIFYNSNFGKWQLIIDGARNFGGRNYKKEAMYWSSTAQDQNEMIKEVEKKFLSNYEITWYPKRSQTGIMCWHAQDAYEE